MKTTNKTLIFSILATFAATRLFGAPDDHGSHDDHDHEEHGHHDEHDHEGHDHERYDSATLPEFLHMMEESVDALASASESGKSDELHEAIETLADAGKALAGKSIDLDENQILRVKSAVSSMEKIAHRLEEALESGKASDAKKYAVQLRKLFASIQARYPEHSHEDHDH